MTAESDGKRSLYLGRFNKKTKPRLDLKVVRSVVFRHFTIRELETGTIEVERDGIAILPAKPALRDVVNISGTPLTTRQLGTQIIRSVQALDENTEE
jgi:hypothetical protein